MDPQRWQEVKKVFDVALELEPSQRLSFIDKSCGDDAVLRREVQKLLDSFDDSYSFIEHPAANEVASQILKKNRTLKSGQRFAHYEILSQIGAGGMGEVYLAHDENLDRRVAIKILNEEFSQHEANVKRFVQEAKAASALNHPNILVIHEIALSIDVNYIVSEYVEGRTLREVIRESKVQLPEILDVAIQICAALIVAHDAKIVHRDIKPENIILRPDGYIKILDFGLAKLVGAKSIGFEASTIQQNETAKGIILGTVNYMSPEQAKGEKVDERTDIFSLGVVIYELIAGKTPFAGDSMSETFANLINIEPQPLSRFASSIPEELERIVSKSLRKNQEERYQTFKDLYSDLKALRKNLEFDQRTERSRQPDRKAKTEIVQATTGFAIEGSGEAQDNTTGRIKNRKPVYAVVLGVFLIGLVGLGYYFFLSDKLTPIPAVKKSLAVLPFINASQDPNAEYLSAGLTESVINSLSRLSGLKVMSRNSAYRFKDNQTDTKNIAAQLAVENLLTGDIQQLGDKLIINVRLLDGSDDSQIWGNQYIRTNSDILATQNEIAQAVAQNLRLTLSGSETQLLRKRYTDNVEAWQLYQRGRLSVFKLRQSDVQRGIEYFKQAIEIDPSYAVAYVGLSEGYRSLALAAENNPADCFPQAEAASRKAIELDGDLAEAYGSLAVIAFWYDWDWAAAEEQNKRAMELNPDSAITHIFYAHLLSNIGRHAEALAEAKRATDLDPLFPFAHALEGQFLLNAGQPDAALDRLKKTFELDPNFWFPHLFAAAAYTEKGMYEQAITEARLATQFAPGQTVGEVYVGYNLAKMGKRAEAVAVLNKLLNLSKTRFVPPAHFAALYDGLGETDKTFEWLEKGFEIHDPKMAFLKVDPKWNHLRSDPRFISLMKRMNLA